MKKLQCMGEFWLFDKVEPTQRETLHGLMRQVSYAKGEVLFSEGDPATSVFLITEGRVKLFKLSEDGREIILGFLTPHDFFGEEILFRDAVRAISAQTVEPTRICSCVKGDFEKLINTNPPLAMRVIQALGEKLNQATEQLMDFAVHDVRRRLANVLARLAREYGQQDAAGFILNFRLTHDTLGALIGASRVMVSNVLRDLRNDGLVSTDANHKLTIHPGLIDEAQPVPEEKTGPRSCPCFANSRARHD